MFNKRKKLLRAVKGIEVEDILLDQYSQRKDLQAGMEVKKLEVPMTAINFIALLALAGLVILALFFSAFRLQLVKGQEFEAMASQNKFRLANLKASRGIIYDSQMKQLVWNETTFNLVYQSSDLPEEKVLEEVAWALGRDIALLKGQLFDWQKNPSQPMIIAKNLSQELLILLEAKKDDLPGFSIQKSNLRKYEPLVSLSHLLGYLGKVSLEEAIKDSQDYDLIDDSGKEGLEKSYEMVLREKKGKIEITTDAFGNELSRQIRSQPESGDSIQLFVDLALEQKAEESLKIVLENVGSSKGVVLALNPQNGGVLALVSYPGFDNNLFAGGISADAFAILNQDKNNPQLNRALAGLYPTGSTLKPFIGLAGLEEGIITEKTSLYCPAELCIENKYSGEGECFPDNRFHGWSNITRAIAESVNPFFFMVGGGYKAPSKKSKFYDERLPKNMEGLGAFGIEKWLTLFGFATTTGIDLPGEQKGRVPTPEWKKSYFSRATDQVWYLGDTYNMSIGQGNLLATPLQLANGFTAVANGGKLFQPQVVQKIIKSDGSIEILPTKIIRQDVASPENIEIIRKAMRQTVASPAGSAYSLVNLPVKAAAKTGTAQMNVSKNINNNWIVVFAPYDNPEIVLLVLIEEVEGLKSAAQVVARDILQWYFTRGKIE